MVREILLCELGVLDIAFICVNWLSRDLVGVRGFRFHWSSKMGVILRSSASEERRTLPLLRSSKPEERRTPSFTFSAERTKNPPSSYPRLSRQLERAMIRGESLVQRNLSNIIYNYICCLFVCIIIIIIIIWFLQR